MCVAAVGLGSFFNLGFGLGVVGAGLLRFSMLAA